MVATTWNERSLWNAPATRTVKEDPTRYHDGQAKKHELEVVEEEDRTYVISHAGLLQKQTGLRDILHHASKGLLILPLILVALAIPVVLPLWSTSNYLLIVICGAHLILVSTILTITAISISYLDVQRGEEGLEARPMTSGDNDPSMGARTLPAKKQTPAA
jgi:hypothetical protein